MQERLNTSTYNRKSENTSEGIGGYILSHISSLFNLNRGSASANTPNPKDAVGDSHNSGSNTGVGHVTINIETGKSPDRTLHLFVCLEKGWYNVQLHQVPLTLDLDNGRLFRTLQRTYYEHRKKFASFWYLKTVVSISFVKVCYTFY